MARKQIIRNGSIVEDVVVHLSDDQALPAGEVPVTVSLQRYQTERDSLRGRAARVGVRLVGEDDVYAVQGYLGELELIALEFPSFVDGRCYSHARLLRERLEFNGELRAVGDVLRDQMFYMKRCGIDAFEVADVVPLESALEGLNDFSVAYQEASDGPRRPAGLA